MRIKWLNVIVVLAVVAVGFGLWKFRSRLGLDKVKKMESGSGEEILQKINDFGVTDLQGEIISIGDEEKNLQVKIIAYSPTREIPEDIRSYYTVGENEQKTIQLDENSQVTVGKLEDTESKASNFESLKEGQKVLVIGQDNPRPLINFIAREIRILE